MAETKLYTVTRDEDRVKMARGFFEYFVRVYMHQHLRLSPRSPIHIPDYHIEDYNRFRADKPRPMRLIQVEPRYYGKTIRKSVFFPLWLMCCQPYGIKEEILLISQSERFCEKNMRKIEDELTTNPFILADFGNLLTGSKVNNTELKILNNGCSVMARGAGAQVRGEHPTQVIVDDLEDREDAQNATLREKITDYFYYDVLPTVGDDLNKSIIVVGTIIHPQSLLADMLRDDNTQTESWQKIRYSAIKDDGEPLWPEKHDSAALDRLQQEMGSLRFSQEMLNQPLVSENSAIRPEWIQYVEQTPERFDLQCVTACDPAFSEKNDSDFTAVVTVGIVSDGKDRGKIYVVDRERGHWSPSDACRTVIAQAVRWKSDVVVMEGVAGAIAMIDLLSMMKRQRNVNFTVRLVKPSRALDKVARAQSVAQLFESGRVYFKKTHRDIVSELLLLPTGEHDDMADAVIWGLREIKNGILKTMNRPQRVVKMPEYVDEMAGY